MAQAQAIPRNPRQARHANRVVGQRKSTPIKQTDANGNDEAITIAYVKKVLCSKSQNGKISDPTVTSDVDAKSLDELLPSLTSSSAVDVQLYAFVAVIVENFLQRWYSRITQDSDLVKEIIQIVAHCTRGLEQRLRRLDFESLLLDEIPDLILRHTKGKYLDRRDIRAGTS